MIKKHKCTLPSQAASGDRTADLSWPKNVIRAGISRSLLWVIPLAVQMPPVSPC
jgi:hypothetical protein